MTMRERVAQALWARSVRGRYDKKSFSTDLPANQDEYRHQADAAITAVIEALAAEADELGLGVFSIDGETTSTFAAWLRAHLDDGRDGEAGRKA